MTRIGRAIPTVHTGPATRIIRGSPIIPVRREGLQIRAIPILPARRGGQDASGSSSSSGASSSSASGQGSGESSGGSDSDKPQGQSPNQLFAAYGGDGDSISVATNPFAPSSNDNEAQVALSAKAVEALLSEGDRTGGSTTAKSNLAKAPSIVKDLINHSYRQLKNDLEKNLTQNGNLNPYYLRLALDVGADLSGLHLNGKNLGESGLGANALRDLAKLGANLGDNDPDRN